LGSSIYGSSHHGSNSFFGLNLNSNSASSLIGLRTYIIMTCCEGCFKKFIQPDVRGVEMFQPPKDSLFARVRDFHLRYTDTGGTNMRTILLIHGFAGCCETWQLIQPLLTQYRVVALDLLGNGFSDKPVNWTYTFREHGSVVAAFIEELGLHLVTIVGHSSGGIVAAQAAVESEKVDGLVLVAPGIFQRIPAFLSYTACAPLRYMLARSITKSRADSVLRAHRKGFVLNSEMVEALVLPSRMPNFTRAIAASIKAREPPYEEILCNVRVPIHIVWAAEDTVNPPSVDRISALIKGSTQISQVVLSDSRHYIQHEQPSKLATEILSFVSMVNATLETA